MAKQNPRQHVALFDGCYRSRFTVHPANWDSAGASVKQDWYFSYRFYDPTAKGDKYPKGKQVLVKGMNSYKTLMERRQATKALLDREKLQLDEKGYNPITDSYMAPVTDDEDVDYVIHPDEPVISALTKAMEKKLKGRESYLNVKSAMKYLTIAARELRIDTRPVKDFQKRHVKRLLEYTGEVKARIEAIAARKEDRPVKEVWSANTYNFYRTSLMILFAELEDWETIEVNPVTKIAIKQVIRKKRTTLSMEQRIEIDRRLRAENYPFWRFMMIFFKSGSRISEMMRVKVKDVDLDNQVFRAVRLKGKGAREIEYTIGDGAVLLWREVLQEATAGSYVFSEGLVPGAVEISPNQVTRRWKLWVKEKMGIDVDFYPLKHLHTTAIANELGTQAAADFNNESRRMIEQHYDTDHQKRKHKTAKEIDIPFVPLGKVE